MVKKKIPGGSKNQSLKKLAAALGAVALIAGSATVAKRTVKPGELVVSVIDGDSFKIANKQTIRLSSLDAPKLEYCMGEESKKALEKMILSKKVILRDVKTDIYRRIMALVYIDGVLVNEYMVKNGFAVTTREGADETERIKAANDFARANLLGVYSPKCYQTDPPDPRCPIKGNIDDRTGEKTYLIPSCRHYSKVVVEKYAGEQWFCSEKEAQKAGYKELTDCFRE